MGIDMRIRVHRKKTYNNSKTRWEIVAINEQVNFTVRLSIYVPINDLHEEEHSPF